MAEGGRLPQQATAFDVGGEASIAVSDSTINVSSTSQKTDASQTFGFKTDAKAQNLYQGVHTLNVHNYAGSDRGEDMAKSIEGIKISKTIEDETRGKEQPPSAAPLEVKNVTLEQRGSGLHASWDAPMASRKLLYSIMLYRDGEPILEVKHPATSKAFPDVQLSKEYFCQVWVETLDGSKNIKTHSDVVVIKPPLAASSCDSPSARASQRPSQLSSFDQAQSISTTTPETNKVTTHRDELIEIESISGANTISANKVTVLTGHKAEVGCCSWNPTCDLLASCSSDSTARIWDLTADAGTGALPSGPVLQHSDPVWRLDWNRDGTSLVTGSDDGSVRIWTKDGHLLHHLSQHEEPIWALKWNKQGNYIVSGSKDETAIIWDAQSGKLKQQFSVHDGEIIDVDWQDNDCFASCSHDKNIHVCRLGCEKPVKSFKGHSDLVWAVKWDPSKRFLASGSSDNTVKIWSMKHDGCVHDLRGHVFGVRKVRWSPAGPGSQNPNQKLLLASASWDSTVRLWEPERGVCLHTLEGHSLLVKSIAFSPDGRLLASGSYDNYVKIWNTQSGQLVRSYEGTNMILDVCWNAAGTKVGAGAVDRTVTVLDLRK